MEKIQERDKRMIHHVEKCLEARDERSSAHLTFQKDKNVTLTDYNCTYLDRRLLMVELGRIRPRGWNPKESLILTRTEMPKCLTILKNNNMALETS